MQTLKPKKIVNFFGLQLHQKMNFFIATSNNMK